MIVSVPAFAIASLSEDAVPIAPAAPEVAVPEELATARADLSAYTDQPSAWAQSAMQWAVAEKLITGKGNGVLDPTGQATRAEIAAIVMRFVTAFAQ